MPMMKVAYPSGSNPRSLSPSILCLKIARHAPCTLCTRCRGLHPSMGVRVVLDVPGDTMSVQDDYSSLFNDSDDEDDNMPPSSYLETCECGHDARTHNADERDLGKREFLRRSAIALRIDELLKDSGRLLDFEYTDEDINTLRNNMVIPFTREEPAIAASSPAETRNSDPMTPPNASFQSDLPPSSSQRASGVKRRASVSSLTEPDDNGSDDGDPKHEHDSFQQQQQRQRKRHPDEEEEEEDESDEEEKPLATLTIATSRTVPGQHPVPPSPTLQRNYGGKGGGKNPRGVGSSSSNANGASRGGDRSKKGTMQNGHKKLRMDNADVPVVVVRPPPPSGGGGERSEKPCFGELRLGVIKVFPVENDRQPRSLIILTGLKNLFQRQLPVMPPEYITRLVYDTNSRALVIMKRGLNVVGGILFRPFPHRGFAEVVFLATNSSDQIKGYGGMLMDYFKAHICDTYPKMHHFLVYADDNAVGYFQKQGFSKNITLDQTIWTGYIKDYIGSTIMQCTLVPKVNYLEKKRLFEIQRDALVEKIRKVSRSHTVYEGLKQFAPGAGDDVVVDPRDVPGLKEMGWTKEILQSSMRSPDYNLMHKMLALLKGNANSWPFQHPVNYDAVPDYLNVIKNPMDFATMAEKLAKNRYRNISQFVDDALLVFENCRVYNPEASRYYKHAEKMEKYLKELLPAYVS